MCHRVLGDKGSSERRLHWLLPQRGGEINLVDDSSIKGSEVLDFVSYLSKFTPSSEDDLDSLIVENDRHYENCVEVTPFCRTLSITNVAADLELLRSSVTTDKPLNFIGFSCDCPSTFSGMKFLSEMPAPRALHHLTHSTTIYAKHHLFTGIRNVS